VKESGLFIRRFHAVKRVREFLMMHNIIASCPRPRAVLEQVELTQAITSKLAAGSMGNLAVGYASSIARTFSARPSRLSAAHARTCS